MPKNNSFHITRVRSMSEKNTSGGMDIDRNRSYSSANYNNNNELLNREGVIYNNNSSHSYSINNNNSGSSSNSYKKKNRNSNNNNNNNNNHNSSSSDMILKQSSYSSSFESPFTSDGIDNIHKRDNSNNSLDLHSGGGSGSGMIHSGGSSGSGGGGGERGSVGGISLASALMTPLNSPSERRNINKQMLHQLKMQNANLLSRYIGFYT